MPGTSRTSSFRNLWRLDVFGVSWVSSWLRQRRPSRPASSLTFTPQLDPFEGRFYPGSMLAWGTPAWVGAAYLVDQALTAPRGVEEVYWDEARAAASDPAAKAVPWEPFETPTPAPETSRAGIPESAAYQSPGQAPAPVSGHDRTHDLFSFTGLDDLAGGLSDGWTEDLVAGLLGPDRAVTKSPGRLPPERESAESAASGTGPLGGGAVAAPSPAG